ncbi:prosaposin-like [Diorhabda sublineata]|uniref:prosaposin-like n=1 Tax=Diorhabda sublineata TaxID=1163346 RepID=UPI0024E05CF2|nr:prosaposin-like [Diorhabda sublineata]
MKFVFAFVVFAFVGLSFQAAHPKITNKGGLLCNICETVAAYVKELAEEDITEDEVTEQIEALCNVLPGQMKELCNDDVLPYVENIYDAINNQTAEEICESLSLC